MALGDILEGQGTVLYVGDTAPPTTEVGGPVAWSAPRKRTSTIRKYYGNTPSKTITGPSEDTWQIQCDLTSGDDGQILIIGHYVDGLEFYVGFTDANGNGRYQKVRATGEQPAGPNPDSPNSATYDFGGTEDPVDVGAGVG
jgi:hypothetical protein